jgi:hypothetical protein
LSRLLLNSITQPRVLRNPRTYLSAALLLLRVVDLGSNLQIICLAYDRLMAGGVLSSVKAIGSLAWRSFQTVFEVIFVPWRSSYEPIKSFLNDESKDVQTGSWRDRKLAELTFVGITVTFWSIYFSP